MQQYLEIPREIWSALYQAADQYFSAQPWKHFDDTHLFGIQDPRTKDVSYCCVLGAAESTYGLLAYRGERPLSQHQMLLDSNPGSFEFTQTFLKLNALIVLRSSRETLTPEDADVIRLLGFEPEERETWPQFRSLVPGSPPILPDTGEILLLTEILIQTLDIVEHNKDKPWRFAYNGIYGTHFVRMAETTPVGEILWSDEWVSSPLASECSAPSFKIKDTPLVQRVRSLPFRTQACLYVDLRWVTSCCVNNGGSRPVFPKLFVVLKADTGEVAGFELFADHENDALIEQRFVATLDELGYIPEHIFTTSSRVQDIIAPLVAGTGCRVRRVGLLPLVDDFMAGLDQFMQKW